MSAIQLEAMKCALCDRASKVYDWFSNHPSFSLRWAAVDVVVIAFCVYMLHP